MSKDSNINSRRQFLTLAGTAALTGVAANAVAQAHQHTPGMDMKGAEMPGHDITPPSQTSAGSKLRQGKTYTPNGWTLPYKMNGGVKEFRLTGIVAIKPPLTKNFDCQFEVFHVKLIDACNGKFHFRFQGQNQLGKRFD